MTGPSQIWGLTRVTITVRFPTLRARKTIYTVVTIIAGVSWLPIMLLGMIVGVGALGLFCILSLLRCIWVMPVESGFVRGFYTATISLGIILLSACLAVVAIGLRPLTTGTWILLVSGALLVALGLLVLLELYGGLAERDR